MNYNKTLDHYKFVGSLLGKAMFDKCPIGVMFCPFIFKRMRFENINLEDIKQFDNIKYNSLDWMSKNQINDILFETFSILNHDNEIIDLKDNGRNIEVTDQNKNN